MTDTEKKTTKRTAKKTSGASAAARTKKTPGASAAAPTKKTPGASATARAKKTSASSAAVRTKKAPAQTAASHRGSQGARVQKRRQEVRRTRIVIGCILAAVLFLVLAVFLPGSRTARQGTLTGVNDDVLQYRPQVEAYCKEYGISEYSTLLLALMQQESSGQGTDVFQCSESPFNTEYENYPGSITDPDYSIRVGVETFAYCLDQAGCRHISDRDALKLAIQEYNFGNNYASWALENYGGYSEESAVAFSEMMKAQLGWESYGDTEYVAHVLRYITF